MLEAACASAALPSGSTQGVVRQTPAGMAGMAGMEGLVAVLLLLLEGCGSPHDDGLSAINN